MKNIDLSLCLTSELRFEQALKEAGIDKPACVRKITVSGMLTDDDFAYIRKNMWNSLQEFDLGNVDIEKIPEKAFYFCIYLTSVTIGSGVTEIGEDAFTLCHNLVHIELAGNPNFCIDNGVLFNKDKTVLIKCMENKEGAYSIPDSVKIIGNSAFNTCSLTSVTIPDGVTDICGNMFCHCARLNSITFGAGVKHIEERAFFECYDLDTIICLSATPPNVARRRYIRTWKFDEMELCVPQEAVDSYMKDDVWKKFYTIAAFSKDDPTIKTIVRCKKDRQPDFDYHGEFRIGLAVVSKDGKFGYINKLGDDITPLKYDFAEDFIYFECAGRVQINDKWGLVNTYGKEIIPLIYDEIINGINLERGAPYIVRIGDKYGYVSAKTGKTIIPVKYDDAKNWVSYSSRTSGTFDINNPKKYRTHYIACVKVGDKWGCINLCDKVVIPMIYDEIDILQGTKPNPAKLNGKWGFISMKGTKIIDFKYDAVEEFKQSQAMHKDELENGLSRVQKDGKWGFINERGKEVIRLKYDDCEQYFSAVNCKTCKNYRVIPIWVKRGDKYGFVDINGMEIIEPIYEFAKSFCRFDTDDKTLAVVVHNGAAGFINEAGEILIPCMYEPDFEDYRNYRIDYEGFVNVRLGGKWGVIDVNNNVVVSFLYDKITPGYNAGFRCAERDGKIMTVDATGQERELKKNSNARTFKEYVHAVEWAQVAESFKTLFDVQCGCDVYETNFNNFKNKQFKPSNDFIRISASKHEHYNANFRVDMFSIENNRSYLFFDWDEILDMEVRIEDNIVLSDADVVAACIFRACDEDLLTEESIRLTLKRLRRIC